MVSPPKTHRSPRPPKHVPALRSFELEVVPGIEPEVLGELSSRFAGVDAVPRTIAPGLIEVHAVEPAVLEQCATIGSVYARCAFDVPRPATLLGEGYRQAFLGFIERVAARHTFRSFRISAAGKDSSVLQDLRALIAQKLRIPYDPDDGDLLVRLRGNKGGWELLVRTTPRPLSARAWRVEDMPGALNATIAAALVQRISAPAGAPWINLCAGSATICIEGARMHPHLAPVGVEINPKRFQLGERNIKQAGLEGKVQFLLGDACRLPFDDGVFHGVVADLPWGERVGNRSGNRELYRKVLNECSRVLLPRRRAQLLTQDEGALEEALAHTPQLRVLHGRKLEQRGYTPTWVELVREE